MQPVSHRWAPPGRRHRLKTLALTVWMTLLIQWTSGQISITQDVITAAVGDTVTLSVQIRGNMQYFNWYRGAEANAQQKILGVNGITRTHGPQYTGREAGLSDGSLQIRDVLSNYTGKYTVEVLVEINPFVRLQKKAYKTISVDIPTSDVDIPTSDWRVTVGVPLGLLPGAAVILTGAVIFYKRCRNHRKIQEDENTYKNSAMVQEPSTLYENVERSTPVLAVKKTQDADATYMDLQHGDQATYGQLERS